MSYIFSLANAEDAEQLVTLINSAYRGDGSKLGWTTEADLLDGRRVTLQDIQRLLIAKDSCLISCRKFSELIGSITASLQQDSAQISMLAVNPIYQGQGVGKRLIKAAEEYASQTWGIKRYQMYVISCRRELIAFYQRLGYHYNGVNCAFPENPEVWQAKVVGLRLNLLEKTRID